MNIVRTYSQEFTPALAAAWLNMVDAQYQRPVNHSYVMLYADEMQRGSWQPTNSIALAGFNGSKMLVNGQHTLLAIVESSVSVRLPVVEYRCENEHELGLLYGHFDKGRKRSFSDTIRATGFNEALNLTITETNKLAAAAVFLEPVALDADVITLVSDSRKMKYAHLWLSEYRDVHASIAGAPSELRNRIISRATLPIALLTTRHAPDLAYEFWRKVASLEGLVKNDPCGTLHRYLVTYHLVGGAASHGMKTSDIRRAVAHSWNKYIQGTTLGKMTSPVVLRRLYPKIQLRGIPLS